MIQPAVPRKDGFPRFRTKLLVAMMLVVSLIAGLTLYFAERSAAANVEENLRREFLAEVNALHDIHAIRQATILERCQLLARKSRIRAALEDGALDLLYPSAREELRDVMVGTSRTKGVKESSLRARFYRFLDRNGAVISPADPREAGILSPREEAQLAPAGAPSSQQIGYIPRDQADAEAGPLYEIFCMPILSSETGETIAALVIGTEPAALGGKRGEEGPRGGIWLQGKLHSTEIPGSLTQVLQGEIARALEGANVPESSFETVINGMPHLLFYKKLNPDSRYAPAYEVSVYPLLQLTARRRQLRWQVFGSGVAVLFLGLLASHLVAGGFSKPVERLVMDSQANRAARQQAELALETTQGELQRAARFSADASHQLKTPVTVLRVGLEEMLARHNLTAEQALEISALIHQTYRLNSVIEDLLLLSKMDAGRLQLEFTTVNLTALIEGWLDDLSALPDPHHLHIETDIPQAIFVEGEKRYTSLILQNLLENARKYNRPGGTIRVVVKSDDEWAVMKIGNTGKPIPEEARSHIFDRFHRATVGENIPGHGLGLNLARELTRLHRGDLRLSRSDAEWTEFEVRFRLSPMDTRPPGGSA